jgi:integrase
MGHIFTTPAGTYQANWRDPTGRKRAKTFKTKKDARAFLARIEVDLSRGTYVDPRAGRVLFRDHAERWMTGRNLEATTTERTASVMRHHVLPRWGAWPLIKIDHMAVQTWVGELGRQLAPRTVAKCLGILSMILAAAVRTRLIPFNPCDGVELPRPPTLESVGSTISREDFFTRLLPAVPIEHRPIIATAALSGLRWGECAGLTWNAVDLLAAEIRVTRTVVEVSGRLLVKPYPKSRAGLRTVPLPPALVSLLREHRLRSAPNDADLVFAVRTGAAWRRSNFRRQVWFPALRDAGLPLSLRFHDLRHCYATWLISDSVPVNVVQRLMGHEQPSTTLNRYTHAARDYEDRVRAVLAAPAEFLPSLGAS